MHLAVLRQRGLWQEYHRPLSQRLVHLPLRGPYTEGILDAFRPQLQMPREVLPVHRMSKLAGNVAGGSRRYIGLIDLTETLRGSRVHIGKIQILGVEAEAEILVELLPAKAGKPLFEEYAVGALPLERTRGLEAQQAGAVPAVPSLQGRFDAHVRMTVGCFTQRRERHHGLIEGDEDIRPLHLHRKLPFGSERGNREGLVALMGGKKLPLHGRRLVVVDAALFGEGGGLEGDSQNLALHSAFSLGKAVYPREPVTTAGAQRQQQYGQNIPRNRSGSSPENAHIRLQH